MIFPVTLAGVAISAGAWIDALVIGGGGTVLVLMTEIWCIRKKQTLLLCWDKYYAESQFTTTPIQEQKTPVTDGAMINCKGLFEIPSLDPGFFEFIIWTPEMLNWGKIRIGLIGFVCVLTIHFGYPPILSHLMPRFLAWGWAATLVLWYISLYFGTEYIRLAPGIVQFITYGRSVDKMSIESFPIMSGTEIVLLGDDRIKQAHFKRNNCERILDFSNMRNATQARNDLWSAILSTAPTPPLSETSLLG